MTSAASGREKGTWKIPKDMTAAVPDSRLAVLHDAGHLVFIGRAREVNREVTSFLGSR
jgi:pimeloyl-ACP methyl ester carboxylesterase